MTLIDIGVNLPHRRFDRDRGEVIARARQARVSKMIITGADAPGSRAACELAESHGGEMFATAGVHPHHARDWSADTDSELRALSRADTVVAIGETGLDFNRDFSPRPAQERVFERQLALAVELGLPVFLHQREAGERFLAILGDYRDRLADAVVHCFTDGRDMLWRCLDLDCHIGVTGWICDERRGDDLRACVGDIPADRLMIETDAPYLLPRDLEPRPRDGRNEPAFLPHVLAAVARLRKVAPAALAADTTANAERFFRLP